MDKLRPIESKTDSRYFRISNGRFFRSVGLLRISMIIGIYAKIFFEGKIRVSGVFGGVADRLSGLFSYIADMPWLILIARNILLPFFVSRR